MLDTKDLLIMSYLRLNARETLTKISRKTNVPVSTVYERIKNKEANLIVKHCALLDFSKMGFLTRAQVLVKAKTQDKKKIEDFLSKHLHVNNLMKINNGYDFVAEVIFRQVSDLETFIDALTGRFKVKHQVHYILSDIKREKFMADPDLIGLIKVA